MIADIVAEDREGRPVLIVDVELGPASDRREAQFLEELATAPATIVFGMLVDPKEIRITRRSPALPEFIAAFETGPILRHYRENYKVDGEPGVSKRLEHIVFSNLLEVWLWSLTLPWQTGQPRKVELTDLGLLPLLEGGTTTRPGLESGHSLR